MLFTLFRACWFCSIYIFIYVTFNETHLCLARTNRFEWHTQECDKARNKTKHIRDVEIQCNKVASSEWIFGHKVHGAMKCRLQLNIANKLPIQFSYAENTATPHFYDLPTSLFLHLLAPEFSSRAKESSPPVCRSDRFPVASFDPLQSNLLSLFFR